MSGIFIKATIVAQAANAFIDEVISDFRAEYDQAKIEATQKRVWFWSEFKLRRRTVEEAEAHWRLKYEFSWLRDRVNNPVLYSADCRQMLKLSNMATKAEALIPGAQVLLSVRDHWVLRKHLG